MLTPRELQIAHKLLSSRRALRVRDLAEELKVSARTIQYDLDNVRGFLQEQGVAFHSGSGKGIWVECADSEREAALRELSGLEKDSLYFNQDMRVRRIFLELIFREGYVTAGALAEVLRVSRNTVLSDMDHMEALLGESGLRLRRQARQGYRLVGAELSLRTLAEQLLLQGMSVYDIYRMVSQLQAGEVGEPFPLPLPDGASADRRAAREAMARAFRDEAGRLQKENVVLLMVRLLVGLVRVRMQRFVGSSARVEGGAHYLSPYLEEAFRECGLPVLRDEVDYILGRYQEEKYPMDVVALCTALIETVSEEENFPYHQDRTLYPRLLTHLRHNFSKEKQHMAPNPFHDLVLQNHPRLFQSIREVCRRYMDDAYLFPNESFISYLALHFLLSQKNLGVGRKLRVVFVCSTGRGAAMLLERMLEAEVRRIQIVRHCSLTEVDEVVAAEQPDFVISIFPISAAVPVVQVEPLPTRANIEAIRHLIGELDEADDPLYTGGPEPGPPDGRQEELSQEAILVGLKLYAWLCEDPACAVREDMQLAFLAHVMLLGNRCVFDRQLRSTAEEQTELDARIKAGLAELDIHLALDEIRALTYYFKTDSPATAQGRNGKAL